MPPVDQVAPAHPEPSSASRSWAEVRLGWVTHTIVFALFVVAWLLDKALPVPLLAASFCFVWAFPGVRRLGPVIQRALLALLRAMLPYLVRKAFPDGKVVVLEAERPKVDP